MKTRQHLAIMICTMLTYVEGCKEPYEPPAIKSVNNYLVVDGTIIGGQDSTIINLSRTRNFGDDSSTTTESQAQVWILDASGSTTPLINQGNGRYVIDQLNLVIGGQYQLKIIASDNKEYLSDQITFKETPAIDSVTWRQDSIGVQIYVNTHDAQNKTRYYRWNFTETWQYNTAYQTYADIQNGVPVSRTSQIYECWLNANSTDIEIASSVKLSDDIIFQNPIALIPTGSEKLGEQYSIFVRQYAISQEAYNYWENLKKNTEQLGTLFDGQPSQLNSNMHCVSSPDEPVLGFVDASNVQTQRIFISKNAVNDWHYKPFWSECQIGSFGDPDSVAIYFPENRPRRYVFLGTNLGAYLFSTLMCGDCTDHGGKNVKPSFWP